MEIRKHVTVLGALYLGTNILGILIALLTFAILFGIGTISGDRTAFGVLSMVAVFTLCFISLFSLPGIVAGVALLKTWSWARMFTLIVAVLTLFNIPIGTAIGVYSFWVLMQPEADALFEKRHESAIVETPTD